MATHTLMNGGGWSKVTKLTHLRTKAPYEADVTPEFRTENFSKLSPTNVSKTVNNAP